MAAGLASTLAAFVTSKFGVAGTLIGAALTSMIITGASAILKAYLENVTGVMRKVRTRKGKAARYEARESPPGRPDLRNNFVGRLRAAFGWFSHISPISRRSILIKGLVGGVVAFVIGMGIVTAVEAGVLGGSLSCKVWGDCTAGVSSGVTGGTAGTAGSDGTSTLGRILNTGNNAQNTQTIDPNTGQPVDPNTGQPVDPASGQPVQPVDPQAPIDSGEPAEPVPQEPAPAPQEPVQPTPSGAAPSEAAPAQPAAPVE